VLATGPNFNTNFAALGLPVPVFARGDTATRHVPGSDALGIVVDAGAAVSTLHVGQAVIIDSWTGSRIRGYETHDGFNAQFVAVDEDRALGVPGELAGNSPEQLAAMLLTYGTAYRCVVERLRVEPGQSILIMGGGKGTSYAGAQIAKALGARVILMGSNRALADELIDRGVADAFVNRVELPRSVYGVLTPGETHEQWQTRTQPFREAVFAANLGSPIDKVFEHTGGLNFPLLVSVLADGGALAFFGATGGGLKGEYKETFFYDKKRMVIDARWVWMRQKQIMFRRSKPEQMFDEIRLPPGRRGLIWGADDYAQEFVKSALDRRSELVVIASASSELAGIEALNKLGVEPWRIIDRDQFNLRDDMPDPLLPAGTPNAAYNDEFMTAARQLGRAIWKVLGDRVSPDFVVDRPDQTTLHYSAFLARDFDERDVMPTGFVLCRGNSDLDILGSHMYHDTQTREVVRLLAHKRIVMEQKDLEVVSFEQLPQLHQMMLDGKMSKPKGVALVQASGPGRPIAEYQDEYLGTGLLRSNPALGRFIEVRATDGIALITLDRPDALNALSEELLEQFADVINEIAGSGSYKGTQVDAVIIRGAGRSFVAGADIQVFVDKTAGQLEELANVNMAVFTALESLDIPVVSLVDGFALGGGNELLMSTHYRIVTENALLGQPEVKLGIIPGYGGMQRLPRIVGPRIAAEMALNGEAIGAEEAVRIGLAHELCRSSTAIVRAFTVAKALAAGVMPLERPDWDARAAEHRLALAEVMADPAVQALLESEAPASGSAGDLVRSRAFAASVALRAMQRGFELGFSAGLASDAKLFGEIVASPSGQFWVDRFLAKDPRQSTFLLQLQPSRF
jgi:enoyl-CoA hydratase